MKRCKKCGAALEGVLYEWIASKIFGIRPSHKEPGACNKCEERTQREDCCAK